MRQADAHVAHCCDSLAGESDHVVEHVAIAGIYLEVFVSRAAIESARNILPAIDAMDTFDLQRLFFANPLDASMRIR